MGERTMYVNHSSMPIHTNADLSLVLQATPVGSIISWDFTLILDQRGQEARTGQEVIITDTVHNLRAKGTVLAPVTSEEQTSVAINAKSVRSLDDRYKPKEDLDRPWYKRDLTAVPAVFLSLLALFLFWYDPIRALVSSVSLVNEEMMNFGLSGLPETYPVGWTLFLIFLPCISALLVSVHWARLGAPGLGWFATFLTVLSSSASAVLGFVYFFVYFVVNNEDQVANRSGVSPDQTFSSFLSDYHLLSLSFGVTILLVTGLITLVCLSGRPRSKKEFKGR